MDSILIPGGIDWGARLYIIYQAMGCGTGQMINRVLTTAASEAASTIPVMIPVKNCAIPVNSKIKLSGNS